MSTVTASTGIVIDAPPALARFGEALRTGVPLGTLVVLVLDARSRLVRLAAYYDLDRRNRWLEELAAADAGSRVILVSVRGGRGRVARPSDEARWDHAADLARSLGVTLVDWWVLTEPDFAYSVARFSKRAAAWVE